MKNKLLILVITLAVSFTFVFSLNYSRLGEISQTILINELVLTAILMGTFFFLLVLTVEQLSSRKKNATIFLVSALLVVLYITGPISKNFDFGVVAEQGWASFYKHPLVILNVILLIIFLVTGRKKRA